MDASSLLGQGNVGRARTRSSSAAAVSPGTAALHSTAEVLHSFAHSRSNNSRRSASTNPHPGDESGHPAWGEQTGDPYISEDVFYANVPEAVWTYQLGGYPVLEKWLCYRQADRRDDKPLSAEERRWFRSIVQRVAALLALNEELDRVYSRAAENAFTAAELGVER